MLEMMAIRLALKQAITFIHHSCIMISTTTVVSYINKQGGTHSPNLCMEVWDILNWCLEHDIVIRVRHVPGKFNILADHLSRLDKPVRTEYSSEFRVPDAQFREYGFVCDPIQLQTPIICHPSSRQQCVSSRCSVCGLESSSLICVSSLYSDPCCSRENSTTSVQNSSNSSILAITAVVLRTSPTLSVSPDSSATNPKTLDSVQRKIHSSKPPSSRPSRLGDIKQSIRDKKNSQNVADFIFRSRRTSTQKVYDAK